jgi:hypothetical protein
MESIGVSPPEVMKKTGSGLACHGSISFFHNLPAVAKSRHLFKD